MVVFTFHVYRLYTRTCIFKQFWVDCASFRHQCFQTASQTRHTKKRPIMPRYVEMLRSGFEQLVGKPLRRTITVDCAYGVGAIALSPIRDAFASMLDIVVCNLPGEGELNAGCGAEFVQKKQLRPAGTPGPGPFASSRRAAAGRAELLAKKGHTGRVQNPAKVSENRPACGTAQHTLAVCFVFEKLEKSRKFLVKIWRKFSKILAKFWQFLRKFRKNQQKFQQFLTKILRLKNGAKECIV